MNYPKLKRFSSMAFVLTAVLGTQMMAFAQNLRVNLGSYAEIALPGGAALQQSSEQMPDFSVYYVTRMQKNLLGIYFGNSPAVDQKKLTSEYKVGECVGKISKESTLNGENLDVVLQLKGGAFPQYVHFFARGLSSQEVADVNQVWRTFRLLGDRSC